MTPSPQAMSFPAAEDTTRKPLLILLSLPAEIIHHILSYLPPVSLFATSLTCSRLYNHSIVDSLWASIVSNLKLTSPRPYYSYRYLHNALAPHLFLPRKVFLSDRNSFGRILVATYNPISGTIEAHPLIEDKPSSPQPQYKQWSMDPKIFVCAHAPKVRLWEETVIKISPFSRSSEFGEIPQPRGHPNVYTTFFRARAFLDRDVHPSMSVWPPRTIPSSERVRNESASGFTAVSHMPRRQRDVFVNLITASDVPAADAGGGGMEDFDRQSKKQEPSPWSIEDMTKSGYTSQKSFRMRKWTAFEHINANAFQRLRVGESVDTFSEVDEELWTPTPEYPFRGIWTGDYSAHGTEFVLFHQPSTTSSSTAKRLEVIKLTGDPNVPRGEYSFIVDDINPSAAIRVAGPAEIEWPGAHVFKARGQIANTEFRNSCFVNVEVIVPPLGTAVNFDTTCEPGETSAEELALRELNVVYEPWVRNEIALFWKEMIGDIKMFRRVNIERLFNER